MGIQLSGIVKGEEIGLQQLTGRKIAVDAYNWIYGGEVVRLLLSPPPPIRMRSPLTFHVCAIVWLCVQLLDDDSVPLEEQEELNAFLDEEGFETVDDDYARDQQDLREQEQMTVRSHHLRTALHAFGSLPLASLPHSPHNASVGGGLPVRTSRGGCVACGGRFVLRRRRRRRGRRERGSQGSGRTQRGAKNRDGQEGRRAVRGSLFHDDDDDDDDVALCLSQTNSTLWSCCRFKAILKRIEKIYRPEQFPTTADTPWADLVNLLALRPHVMCPTASFFFLERHRHRSLGAPA